MIKLIKLALFNVKNVIYSRNFMFCIIGAFAYSMFWFLGVHPKLYGLREYTFEFTRFLYVVMLYASTLIFQNDIKSNTVKTLFTGIYTRTEIMISKAISLILLGGVFAIIVEINNLFISLCSYKKIGIKGFLSLNHVEIFITYIGIVFSMGWLLLLIVSVMFKEKKRILAYILILATMNFFNSGIIALISRKPEIAQKFSTYIKTPFYKASELMVGEFYMNGLLTLIVCGMIFFILSALVMNNREIR